MIASSLRHRLDARAASRQSSNGDIPLITTSIRSFSLRDWVLALRLTQWSKNAILLAGVVFAHQLDQADSLLAALLGIVAFSLVSSGNYLINDVRDAPQDRVHPIKRLRPIARGVISPLTALAAAAGLFLAGALLALWIRPLFLITLLVYVLLMLAYSFVLKHIVLLDVFVIAAGFVLRAVAGAVAVHVPISAWLLLCTMLLALFLGFCKRRHELALLRDAAPRHRASLSVYSYRLLDQFIAVTAAATIVAYSIYTFEAHSVPTNNAMMLTIPFVVFALFRYLALVYRRGGGGNPESLLFRDGPLLLAIAGWGGAALIVLYIT